MKKLILAILLGFCIFTFLAKANPVLAESDFNVTIDREYSVNELGELKVTETHTVKNVSQNRRIISKSNEESFQVSVVSGSNDKLQQSVATAVLTIDGVKYEYTVSYQGDKAIISIPYPREVTKNQQLIFTLTYTNFGLVQRVGALFDIYAPGFAKDISFVTGLTSTSYNTKVKVSAQLPEENFIIPTPFRTIDENGYREYNFAQDSLIGNTIWIQRGRVQYYEFKINQSINPTDSKNTGYENEYKLILPRDIDEGEVYQKVYFKKVTPSPYQVVKDSEDNLVATFKFSSSGSAQISIEGYAAVGLNNLAINSENSGKLADLKSELVKEYTKPGAYWEVNSAEIQALAREIKGDKTNIYDIISATYKRVVDSINYSEVKRFGLNERKGALKTLQEGAGVCMEYSDLFLALVRAQGIPARATFGYGYDSKLDSKAQEAHQWVNVYLPGTGKWVSVDVTWGESGTSLIGGDLNHFYTHIAAADPNSPPMIERVSYGNDVPLQAPDFEISASAAPDQSSSLQTQTALLQMYPQKQENKNVTFVDWILGIRDKIIGSFSNDADKTNFSRIFIVFGIVLILLSSGTMGYIFVKNARKSKLSSKK